MSIHHIIRAGRLRLDMTEQRFADTLGVTRSAVQQWERGATAPSRAHQQAVATLIGVTVGELMSGESSQYPDTLQAQESKPTPYDVSLYLEVRSLLEAMNDNGHKEALKYMKYLVSQHPVEQPGSPSHSENSDISKQAKAA